MNLAKTITKFIFLLAASIAIYHINIQQTELALLGVLVLFYLCGYNHKTVWHQLKTISWFLLFLFVLNWLSLTFSDALLYIMRTAVLYLLAALFSLTTPVSVIMTMFEKLFKPLGFLKIDVRALALLFAMSLRFIPLITALVQQIKEAQRSRSIERDMSSLLQASFINILKMQNQVAEAIEARGFSLEDK